MTRKLVIIGLGIAVAVVASLWINYTHKSRAVDNVPRIVGEKTYKTSFLVSDYTISDGRIGFSSQFGASWICADPPFCYDKTQWVTWGDVESIKVIRGRPDSDSVENRPFKGTFVEYTRHSYFNSIGSDSDHVIYVRTDPQKIAWERCLKKAGASYARVREAEHKRLMPHDVTPICSRMQASKASPEQ